MAYSFSIPNDALKRFFSIYVVKATLNKKTYLYVGKTDDNREGCNPIISRCGNHFSYNNTHSQIRINIQNHESYNYTYYFDHFDEYTGKDKSRNKIDVINEMERWLNEMVQMLLAKYNDKNISLLNPYKASGVKIDLKVQRHKLRTNERSKKLGDILALLEREM